MCLLRSMLEYQIVGAFGMLLLLVAGRLSRRWKVENSGSGPQPYRAEIPNSPISNIVVSGELQGKVGTYVLFFRCPLFEKIR